MRIASLAIISSLAALAVATTPALAKNTAPAKPEDKSVSSSCHAYQMAADGSWTVLPLPGGGRANRAQAASEERGRSAALKGLHSPAARSRDDRPAAPRDLDGCDVSEGDPARDLGRAGGRLSARHECNLLVQVRQGPDPLGIRTPKSRVSGRTYGTSTPS